MAGLREPEGDKPMRRGLETRSLRAGLLALGAFLLAHEAGAAIVLTPNAAALYPTQAVTVTANLSGLPILASGTGTLSTTGLAGVSTIPAVITFTKLSRQTVAAATFQIVVAASAVAATGTMVVTDVTFGGGSAPFTLTILEPKLTLSILSPTITLGASTINVNVRVQPDPGFGANVGAGGVPLQFGVDVGAPPANVTAGGIKYDLAPYGNTLTFPFSRTGVVVPGSYTVTLAAVWTGTTRLLQSATSTLTLNIPDISVVPPAFPTSVCNGGLASTTNPYAIVSNFGYAGTATTNPVSVPPGLTPVGFPKTYTLAAGQTLQQPFTFQALGAAVGNQIVTASLVDAAAGINKTYPVGIRVINPDVTATTTSPSISLQAGGASQAFTANTTGPPITCNAFNTVDYTVTGLPAGFTPPGTVSVTPAPGGPYPAANLPISAGAGVVPGSYPANVHFNVPKTGQSGDVPVTVNVVAGPDFTLSAAPNVITIKQGQTGNTVISLNALNGFNGVANCTIPAIQSITPSPNAFTVGVGKPTSVAFTVAANAAPGTYTASVDGTAAGDRKSVV